MKRLRLMHNYHDAKITSIEYPGDSAVVIGVELCSYCNGAPGPATLSFHSVRNYAEVKAALESARQTNAERSYLDEIVGIARDDQRGILLDLMTAGAVRIDARGFHEA